jgi:outer membrane protein
MTRKIISIAGIVCLIILSLGIYHQCTKAKIIYVDIPKVFNGFEMKKEFQDKYKKTEAVRKRVLDSLSFNLQLLAKKLDQDAKNGQLMREFDLKREDYLKRKNIIEQDNLTLSNQYDKQILEQMSQYIADYGKQNGFDLILGADGNGTLMYAAEKMNISDEIIQYINDRYKGNE